MVTKRLNFLNTPELAMLDILEDFVKCIENIPKSIREYLIFKGGLALLSSMNKYNKKEYERLTTDIDIHCDSIKKWEEFKTYIPSLGEYSDLNLRYSITDTRELSLNGVSETLQIKASSTDGGVYNFSIDMNLNNSKVLCENYTGRFNTLDFTGYAPEVMLCDKLSVLALQKICRRSKDLHDIYALSKLKDMRMELICSEYLNKHTPLRETGVFGIDPDNREVLEHAYGKLKGVKNKIEFETLYGEVLEFTVPIYYSLIFNKNRKLKWISSKGVWVNGTDV